MIQLLGAMVAGHFYAIFHAAGPNKDVAYMLQPGKGYTFLEAGMAELVFTGILAYTVLATATVSRPRSQRSNRNSFFGLAIACCVIAGGFAIGKVSGGELNPAVTLGITFANIAHSGSGQMASPANFLTFSFWQLSGGILAALAFRFTHDVEYLYRSDSPIQQTKVPETTDPPLSSRTTQASPSRTPGKEEKRTP